MPTLRRNLWPALATGAVLTGATWLTAILLGVDASFQTLADQMTRWLPARVFSFILFRLQHWAKPLLLLGLALSWTLLGAALALLAWRATTLFLGSITSALVTWLLPVAILSPLAGLGLGGTGSAAGPLRWTLAALLPALLYGLLLYYAAPRTEPAAAQPLDRPPRDNSKRQFLWVAGSAVAVAGAALLLRDARRLSRNVSEEAIASGDESLDKDLTPTGSFFVVSKNFSDPRIDASKWQLKVSGLVERPQQLTYAQVLALPSRQENVTLECISNQVGGYQIGNALWTGIPLAALLQQVGTQSGASYILTRSEDGYSESLPLEKAMDPDVFLAYQMNGAALRKEHGFPLRLLVPGRYGMKSTKWLTEIVLSATDKLGYWEERGWDNAAIVKTDSRIDAPEDGGVIPLAPYTLRGIAYGGDRGIQKVELSTDRGDTWLQADLSPALSKYSWVRWSLEWTPPAKGRYLFLVRATDLTGTPRQTTRPKTSPTAPAAITPSAWQFSSKAPSNPHAGLATWFAAGDFLPKLLTSGMLTRKYHLVHLHPF